MGRDLFEAFPAAQKIFQRADQILGEPISELCMQGPEEELTRTRVAQPAIFVTSMAALACVQTKWPDQKPSLTAGLSLGEFTALVAADALSFEEGLRLVQKRAEAMESAAQRHPGTMASIMGFSKEICDDIAKESGCEIANWNAPDQFVFSGSLDSIERACHLADGRGAKRAISLKVGGAFHSALMREAEEDLQKALAEAQIRRPRCLFVPNTTAQPVSDPEQIRSLLARQLTSPVLWMQTMRLADEKGIHHFLEIGPGKVLKGLARRCSSKLSVEACGTVQDLQNLERTLVGT